MITAENFKMHVQKHQVGHQSMWLEW